MKAGIWTIGLGILGTVIVVAAMLAIDVSSVGAESISHTALHNPLQQGLRISLLFIVIGALMRLRSPPPKQWKWVVVSALAILACGVAGEFNGILVRMGWTVDPLAGLGADDSLERRLFRLGAMATFAIPMLVILAVVKYKHVTTTQESTFCGRLARLLLRWEPLLFAIGVVTLPGILIAGALVDKEITWLLPIGADTTFAACAAAAIRTRRSGNRLSSVGWFAVAFSMAIGLAMGSYSFGGPVPTPKFIGDYGNLPRTLLRDGHVIIMSLGFVAIAIAMIRKPHVGGVT